MMNPTCRLRTFPSFLFVLLVFAVVSTTTKAYADDTAASSSATGRLFELRTYTTAEGKLPNLHERFRDHTNRIFVKHGMSLIAYWTPDDKPNTLIYVLAYPNREARDASWKAFMADPEWKQVWAASKEKAGGPIVTKVESVFMNATDYSPIH